MKSFSRVSILFVFLLLSPGYAEAGFSSTPKDLAEACDALAQKLARGIPDGKSVAVRPFLSGGGNRTLLSIRIQDLLTNALSEATSRKYHVVERLRMAELDVERMTFGADAGGDLDGWARGLKADAVVTGTYGEADQSLTLDCRLVAPDSGRALCSARVETPLHLNIKRLADTPAPSNATAGVFEAVIAPENPGKAGKHAFLRLFRVQDGEPVAFPSDGPLAFRVGEMIGFSVRPPMDCRLYIFNYDPQGEEAVIFLYPLPQVPVRIFKKDESAFFPGTVDSCAVSYPVEPPLGRMVFKVIGVSEDAVHGDLIEGLDGAAGYYQLHQRDLKPLIHRLALLPMSAWWEESVEFWVLE